MTQRLEELVNLSALENFLRQHLFPQKGELSVEKHEAGYSNETFYVSWGSQRWVMRRPPQIKQPSEEKSIFLLRSYRSAEDYCPMLFSHLLTGLRGSEYKSQRGWM